MSLDCALSFVVVRACIPTHSLVLLPTPTLVHFFCVLPVPPHPAAPAPSSNIVIPSVIPSASLKFNSEKYLFLDGKC